MSSPPCYHHPHPSSFQDDAKSNHTRSHFRSIVNVIIFSQRMLKGRPIPQNPKSGDEISKKSGILRRSIVIPSLHSIDEIRRLCSVFAAPKMENPELGTALLYCRLFPQGYEFEKQMVLQMWLAGGIFTKQVLEFDAAQFFDSLVSLGYILPSKLGLVTNRTLYTCSNTADSLLPRDTHVILDTIPNSDNNNNKLSTRKSHVSVKCTSPINFSALDGLKRFNKLKTLLFLDGNKSSFKQVPRDLFLSLGHLQILDLSRTHIAELPSSIANMRCLCYLDLSHTPIRRLPEIIDTLIHLQTLKLKGCSNLYMLPNGTQKLVNLRHLDLDVLRQLQSMPKGIGALTKLQTLSAFIVGQERGCSIVELENMNNLTGSFCISRLENVNHEAEAFWAGLCKKSQLTKLELRWDDSTVGDEIENSKTVLSYLKPNESLEELRIAGYGGIEMPTWIHSNNPVYSILASITLFNFENCEVMPPLGKLPALKYLNIVGFRSLKLVDYKFRGRISPQGFIAFPKLEKLTIENMFDLEEWTGFEFPHFPCLLKLSVKDCPRLHSLCTLSHLCSLTELQLSHCPVLTFCFDGKLSTSVDTLIVEDCPLIDGILNNEDENKVAHIPNVWIDNKEMPFGQRSPQV